MPVCRMLAIEFCVVTTMTEHAARIEREFHVGPAGERWTLARDLRTGLPTVLHCKSQDARAIELDLGSFLVLFKGQERDELLRLIGSLLPDGEPPAATADMPAPRPARFVSRWIPRARS